MSRVASYEVAQRARDSVARLVGHEQFIPAAALEVYFGRPPILAAVPSRLFVMPLAFLRRHT